MDDSSEPRRGTTARLPPTSSMPPGLELVRTTPEFDETSVPGGLLAFHRVASGVWGRLVVVSGAIGFQFEDDDVDSDLIRTIAAGESQVIPPERPHRVVPIGAVRFVVEFHRPPVRLEP